MAAPVPYFYSGIDERFALHGRHSPLTVFSVTILVTVGAILLRMALDDLGTGIVPYAIFFPVVLVCTLFGGTGAGILSLALSSAAAVYFWVEPIGQWSKSGPAAISFVLFLLSNAINIFVAQWLRRTLGALRESEARLNLSQSVGRIGIWDLDLRTGSLWWSPSFREVTGIGVDQVPSVQAFMACIVEQDRERARQCFEDARRGLDRLDIDFRFRRKDGAIIWLAGRAELLRDASGRPARLLGINFDATPIRTAENERDRANSLLHTFFESLPGAAFAKDLEGRYLLGNPIFASAVGHNPEFFLGRDDLEVLADKEVARTIMANDQAIIAAGEMRQIEEKLVLPNGEMSHWLAVKTPFFDAAGQPQGIMGISLDVTDRRMAEERLRFLADEVDHRAKNLLGVVLSLVRLTKVEDVKAFKAAVSGRIEALARAHTLLAANRWQGVDIDTLLREEIAPFARDNSERVALDGPAVMLVPNAAQALAMALHELAINAAVYGALSVEEGRLAVSWHRVEEGNGPNLVLNWRETGGPPVQPPASPGFGSTAIRGAIEHQLDGEIDIDWAATGLACRITFPVLGNVAGDAPPQADPAALVRPTFDADGEVALEGKRVLILEDEALIALTLMDAVRDLGCDILGPANTVAAALGLIRDETPDFAIIDVNIAGSGSAPVAEALRNAGVPFVYCTGYAEPALQIAPELLAPMLTKPVDPVALAAALRNLAVRQKATA
ncbi:PAS domain S-box protein [Erythrobacter sp. WG]|uniref:PAS domain S-box protein n=1 Tax=Erythrobacter sp. WG TaxID=2985510 RepID=UPI00226EFF5B|nr:PAS domain S-box protein [Erythrobacter sp. WG]MCX9145897.1 PAS domain S-box protein [Erythrobacter sp. WG]